MVYNFHAAAYNTDKTVNNNSRIRYSQPVLASVHGKAFDAEYKIVDEFRSVLNRLNSVKYSELLLETTNAVSKTSDGSTMRELLTVYYVRDKKAVVAKLMVAESVDTDLDYMITAQVPGEGYVFRTRSIKRFEAWVVDQYEYMGGELLCG